MVGCAVAQAVDYLLGNAVWISFRLLEGRRNGADQDCFGHATFTVLGYIARYLAAARRVADVDRVLKIQRFDDFERVSCVGVHVVAFVGLCGAAMSAAIMGDYPVAVAEEEHHLRVPVVGG